MCRNSAWRRSKATPCDTTARHQPCPRVLAAPIMAAMNIQNAPSRIMSSARGRMPSSIMNCSKRGTLNSMATGKTVVQKPKKTYQP